MTTDAKTLEAIFSQIVLSLPRLITAVFIFVVALAVAGIVAGIVKRWALRRKLDPPVALLLSRLARWTVIVFGIIFALQQINFNVAAFVAALGIIGFTVGFALQDISKNFVAGLLLLLQRPIQIGDAISVVGYSGTVVDVSLRATIIRTFDGLRVYIPNADVYASPLTNFSQAEQRRVALRVGVAYGTELETATRTALAAIDSLSELALPEPKPKVVFDTFGLSSIEFTLYFWIDTAQHDFQDAQDKALKALKQAFEAAGISIPFPIQTVFIQQPIA